MKKFDEIMTEVKNSLHEMISSETPTETLEKFKALENTIDSLNESHNALAEEHSKIKDLYIESIKNYGTANPSVVQKKTPRTLEQIAQDIKDKEKK